MRSELFAGRYLFHLHTTYTDGQPAVAEYFAEALRLGFERLIFLEHIRRSPKYDVTQFATDVARCAATSGLPGLVGFEAKVLPGGDLDISEEHAALATVIGIAEHGFPNDFGLWQRSLREALEGAAAQYGDKELVWVHPGLWLKKQGLLAAEEPIYRELLDLAQGLGIKVERNLRYGLLPVDLLGQVRPAGLVLGADAHRLADLAAVAHLLG